MTVVCASARTLVSIPLALAISFFWNGVVWTLAFAVASATVFLITGSVPSWMPDPGAGGQPVSVGFVILFWVFLAPFLMIGLVLLGSTLVMIFGRVEVRLRGAEGTAFAGIGPVGRTHRFDASRVTDVRDEMVSWSRSGPDYAIVIEWGRRTKIGSMLPDDRREWMCAVLRRLLIN